MERKLWHLLHKVMKGEEDVDCGLCGKSVLRIPTYKCLDCNFFVHESCGEEPNTGMEVEHDLCQIHRVISTKLNKHGKKEAVCSLCEKRVPHSLGKNVSIIYKCIIPDCNFLTHESCIELPVMMAYESHDHTLLIRPPSMNLLFCDVCKDFTIGSFFYSCDECSYGFHTKCTHHWKVKANKCNPHKYVAIRKPIEFICDACGKKSVDVGRLCHECRLLIHLDCARFICNIRETGHEHPLTFTLSLSQDKHNKCQACGEKVNTNYGAYCCKEGCEYVFHVFCGYGIEQQGGANDPHGCPPYLVAWIGDRKDVGLKIHPSDPKHEVIWKNEEPKDKVCQGCEESIFVPPFYNCGKCDLCLHIRCAHLPQEVERPASHSHTLSLHNAPSDVKGSSFSCWECERLRHGFSYRCLKCDTRPRDIQCSLIPDGFTHLLHKYQLFRGLFGEATCKACGIYPWCIRTFLCKTCDFKVCIRCLTLPLKAKHKYDKHLLNLVNTLKDNPDENYCQICEEKIDQELWFYYCTECDFSGHSLCVLGKKT